MILNDLGQSVVMLIFLITFVYLIPFLYTINTAFKPWIAIREYPPKILYKPSILATIPIRGSGIRLGSLGRRNPPFYPTGNDLYDPAEKASGQGDYIWGHQEIGDRNLKYINKDGTPVGDYRDFLPGSKSRFTFNYEK